MRLFSVAIASVLSFSAVAAEACPTYAQQGASYSYQGAALTAGQSLSVITGGPNNLSTCPQPGVGYVATAPDFTFYLSGMDAYALDLSVVSQCDATLLVNTADANWLFDDDSNGNLDPRMQITGTRPLDGRVDVWVGSYDGQQCQATLTMRTAPLGGTPTQPGGKPGGTVSQPQTPPPPTAALIRVLSATYGGNCGAPQGNVTNHIAQQCNGQQSCTYLVDYTVIGDPAVGCSKDYVVSYDCGDGQQRSARAEPEAGYRSPVALQCTR